MADNQGAATTSLMRDYRKGNWTVSETMILIEAKKMDDERRMKRSTGNDSEGGSIRINKPAELRWKWVEDYCWRKGCMRSQNQCNDKWDNLMRDYKKVRDYERKVVADHQGISTSSATDQSYWKLEKNERKDKNLPTNMLPQIYEALVEVVEKKPPRALAVSLPITSTAPATVVGYNVVERSIGGGGGGGSAHGGGTSIIHHHQQQTPLVASAQALLQHHISPSPVTALPLPPAVPAAPSPMQAQPLQYPQPILPTMCDSSDSDTSDNPSSHSPAKRRRRTDQQQQQQQQQGTTSASARISTGTSSSTHEVAFAISKSASIIAEALQACEEREERRHRDLLSLHERRLKIEESKTEVNREGINGLVDAINNLANSIQALASDKHQSASKPS